MGCGSSHIHSSSNLAPKGAGEAYELDKEVLEARKESAEASARQWRADRAVALWSGNTQRAVFGAWAQARAEAELSRQKRLQQLVAQLHASRLGAAARGWRCAVARKLRARATGLCVVQRMERLKQAAAHCRWSEYTKQIVAARRMAARLLKGHMFACFDIWREFGRQCAIENRVAAERIQAQRRGQLARRERRQQREAVTLMQRLVRGKQSRQLKRRLLDRRAKIFNAQNTQPSKIEPGPIEQLVDDVTGIASSALQSCRHSASHRRLSSEMTHQMASLLAPYAPVTEAELELIGVSSRQSRLELMRLCAVHHHQSIPAPLNHPIKTNKRNNITEVPQLKQQRRIRQMLAIASHASVSAQLQSVLRLAQDHERRHHHWQGGSFHVGGAAGAEAYAAGTMQRQLDQGIGFRRKVSTHSLNRQAYGVAPTRKGYNYRNNKRI